MYRLVERGTVIAVPRQTGVEEGLRSLALVMGFALLTALGAQVRIPLPFTPVPLTLQTFFVLLSGLALGANLGATAQLVYLSLGVLGAPFFAGGALGLAYLLGPTGGYLVGFVASAWLVGRLARGIDVWSGRAPPTMLTILALGSVVVYLPGVFWLAWLTGKGPWPALLAGVLPFLPGDALKTVLAATLWLRLARRSSLGISA